MLRAAGVIEQRRQHGGHAADRDAAEGLGELERQPWVEMRHEHMCAEGLNQSEGQQPAAGDVEQRHRVDDGFPGAHADGCGG